MGRIRRGMGGRGLARRAGAQRGGMSARREGPQGVRAKNPENVGGPKGWVGGTKRGWEKANGGKRRVEGAKGGRPKFCAVFSLSCRKFQTFLLSLRPWTT